MADGREGKDFLETMTPREQRLGGI
jgi:hypothetical protein